MFSRVVGYLTSFALLALVVFFIVDANLTTTTMEDHEETIFYSTETVYDDTMREGTSEVKQDGKNGSKTVTYSVTYKHDKEVDRKKESEKILEPAQNKILVKGTKKYYTCSNGNEYDNLADKNECEKRVSWEEQRDEALQECYADDSKFNCWYDEYPGTYIHWSYYTYNYTPSYYTPSYYTPSYTPSSNYRTGAICSDGWRSSATGRGACSHHGGVSYWLP